MKSLAIMHSLKKLIEYVHKCNLTFLFSKVYHIRIEAFKQIMKEIDQILGEVRVVCGHLSSSKEFCSSLFFISGYQNVL